MSEQKPARVRNGELVTRGRRARWRLWLACGHEVWRMAPGVHPKLPRKVRSCEKCEMIARIQAARP